MRDLKPFVVFRLIPSVMDTVHYAWRGLSLGSHLHTCHGAPCACQLDRRTTRRHTFGAGCLATLLPPIAPLARELATPGRFVYTVTRAQYTLRGGNPAGVCVCQIPAHSILFTATTAPSWEAPPVTREPPIPADPILASRQNENLLCKNSRSTFSRPLFLASRPALLILSLTYLSLPGPTRHHHLPPPACNAAACVCTWCVLHWTHPRADRAQ